MASQSRDVVRQGEREAKEKRKPLRDPEKRRRQNIQAQKKYREKLRERLGHLEALAASVAPSRALEITSATGSSQVVLQSSSISLPLIAPRLATLDAPISTSSATTPYQPSPPVDTLSIWESTTHIDPCLLIRAKQNNNSGQYWITTINCCSSTPHVRIRTKSPDPANYGEVKILSFGCSPADPYTNNIRVEVVCVTAALYHLGNCLGVGEEILCADASVSSFYRSSIESADDMAKESVVSTVQSIFKTLKPSLRPSREQIMVPHHPFIDILPFPTVRRNLIIMNQNVDEDEFFTDMLTGLVCWGGAGVGKRDRETGFTSTGTPWDVRSWEAKVWFLRKYWNVLGGEDGELVQQSEWWRSMRGEETLNMDVS